MLDCFQTQENISISIKIVSKREYERYFYCLETRFVKSRFIHILFLNQGYADLHACMFIIEYILMCRIFRKRDIQLTDLPKSNNCLSWIPLQVLFSLISFVLDPT